MRTRSALTVGVAAVVVSLSVPPMIAAASIPVGLAEARSEGAMAGRAGSAPSGGSRISWPQFHNSIDRSGDNPNERILNVGNVGNLVGGWTRTTTGAVWSSAAVVNGVVYIGSDNGKVYAFDALTGIKLWNYVTGAAVRSSPAVVDGVVYVGSDDDKVYAIRAATGTKLWSYQTGDRIADSSPLVVNGMVFIGSRDGTFYALDAGTGSLRWSYDTWGIWESAAYDNGTVFVGSDKSTLWAFNALTGALRWSATVGGRIRCTPSVANGTVFVGADDYRVYAYNSATGALKWKSQVFPNAGIVRSSPALSGGYVYVDTGETDPMGSNVYALDVRTGATAWSTPMSDYSTSSPAVAGGVVFTGSFDHQLHAFDAQTGEKLWTSGFDLMDGGIPGSPAVLNGAVYAGNLDGEIWAFWLP